MTLFLSIFFLIRWNMTRTPLRKASLIIWNVKYLIAIFLVQSFFFCHYLTCPYRTLKIRIFIIVEHWCNRCNTTFKKNKNKNNHHQRFSEFFQTNRPQVYTPFTIKATFGSCPMWLGLRMPSADWENLKVLNCSRIVYQMGPICLPVHLCLFHE